MKKIISLTILILILSTLLFPGYTIFAQEETEEVTPPETEYQFLSPLPDPYNDGALKKTFDPSNTDSVGVYLNLMIKLFIGICAVLAVVMIVMGGIEYMTSELPGTKAHGKETIVHAIFGLLLALGAWTILNEINPKLLDTDLSSLADVKVNVVLAEQLKFYSGQGTCEPITNTSSPCSVDKLEGKGFTNATEASAICNAESNGVPSLASGVDKCSDGKPFSYGLFQINLIAHENEIPGGVCSNIFQTNGGGTQGACLERQGSICVKYDCRVQDTSKLQSCINYITNPANNIAYASYLQRARGWNQWGANNSCRY